MRRADLSLDAIVRCGDSVMPPYTLVLRNGSGRPTTRERLEDLLREIGTLLLAFAPLDVALSSERPNRWPILLLFLSLGMFFLAIALLAERRRPHDN